MRIRAVLCVVAASGLLLTGTNSQACEGGKPRKPVSTPTEKAKRLYGEAEFLEKAGHVREAVELYHEAARGKHGPAARRLAEIYERGKGEVSKDYGQSVRWYGAAYEMGEDIRYACGR